MSQNEFRWQSSLSQQLSNRIPLYSKLAGADKELSDSIAVLSYVTDPEKEKLLEKDPIQWTIGLLDVLRMSAFATSEKVNEISKMGMQMPRGDDIVGLD